jgi:hypothetical protein
VLTILKSERFQKEYNEFSEKIAAVNIDTVKTDLTKLLNQLVNEVKVLDNNLQDSIGGQKSSYVLDETRNRITEIRRQIDKKLSDYESSQNN